MPPWSRAWCATILSEVGRREHNAEFSLLCLALSLSLGLHSTRAAEWFEYGHEPMIWGRKRYMNLCVCAMLRCVVCRAWCWGGIPLWVCPWSTLDGIYITGTNALKVGICVTTTTEQSWLLPYNRIEFKFNLMCLFCFGLVFSIFIACRSSLCIGCLPQQHTRRRRRRCRHWRMVGWNRIACIDWTDAIFNWILFPFSDKSYVRPAQQRRNEIKLRNSAKQQMSNETSEFLRFLSFLGTTDARNVVIASIFLLSLELICFDDWNFLLFFYSLIRSSCWNLIWTFFETKNELREFRNGGNWTKLNVMSWARMMRWSVSLSKRVQAVARNSRVIDSARDSKYKFNALPIRSPTPTSPLGPNVSRWSERKKANTTLNLLFSIASVRSECDSEPEWERKKKQKNISRKDKS